MLKPLKGRARSGAGLAAACIILLGTVLSASWIHAETARVKRVFDGDTVELEDGRRVRYLGINAPEWQEPVYLKAKRRNEELVLQNVVRLEYEQETRDSYGRLLAWVHVGEDVINIHLVKEGLAHVFIIPPNRGRTRELLQAQEDAREKRLGIWRHIRGPLKVTRVRMAGQDAGDVDQREEYVRLANVSPQAVSLRGHQLFNEAGRRYVFPDFGIEPGYSVLVITGDGKDGKNARGQLVLYWNSPDPIWDKREDTAYIEDPTGNLVDVFHYKGRRVSPKLRPRPVP